MICVAKGRRTIYRKQEEDGAKHWFSMAVNINNPETERLARKLARRRGTSITEAVTHALQKDIEQERRQSKLLDAEERLHRIRQIVERFNARPLLDDRSDDEILGYNEQGLFD